MKRLSPLLLLLSACAGTDGPPAPEGWKTIGDPQAFTLQVSNTFEKQPGESEGYKNETVSLRFEFGPHADALTSAVPTGAQQSVESVFVERYPARVVRTSRPSEQTWSAAIHVWGFDKEDKNSLTVTLTSTEPLSSTFANQIFSSIHFPAPQK